MQKKVLIAGASRGIGLELAVQYAADGWNVIAGCRHPQGARSWLPAGVDIQSLDVTSVESIAGLAWHLDDAPLDLLIVCAGVYGPDTEKFLSPSNEEFDQVMHTNVLGPMRIIQTFGPTVAKVRGKIVVISSEMGSISRTISTRGMLYRSSKAALNMVTKLAACEFGPQGVTAISMHPGWVRTDMGGPQAVLSVTESVDQMRQAIAQLSPTDNGHFLDYAGEAREW